MAFDPPERSITHQSGSLAYVTEKVTLVDMNQIPCAAKSQTLLCTPAAASVAPESADAAAT